MRIAVFGNSGSGKSTYAKALVARHGLAHLDLDTITWVPGQIAVRRSQDAISGDLLAFFEREAQWVIEGCYGDVIEAALPYCTQLVFLNPGLEACLANNLRRPWEPHKYASKAEQDAQLAFLQRWVTDYYERDGTMSYQCHRRVFDAFTGDKLELTTVAERLQPEQSPLPLHCQADC